MPFPLAHPAVVLPLRRIQWLSLSALMLGCLVPDVSYGLPITGSSRFAHSALGSVLFCLPVGMTAYLVLRLVRQPLIPLLPAPHRQVLLSLCHPRRQSWLAIALSVWIGACSHILLDAMTHESHMLVPHLVGLRSEIAAMERGGIHFTRLLWVALSGAGLAVLVYAYARLVRERTGRWSWFDRRETRRYLLWFALVLVPFFLVVFGTEDPTRHWPWRYRLQHFVYDTLAWYLIVISSLVILLGLALRLYQAILLRATSEK